MRWWSGGIAGVGALVMAACGPTHQLRRYAEDATAIQTEHEDQPRLGVPAWIEFLRTRLPEAEAAADALIADTTTAADASAALESLAPRLTALEEAERRFARRVVSDPQLIDTLRALGADEVEALNTRHRELWSRLNRALRSAGGAAD